VFHWLYVLHAFKVITDIFPYVDLSSDLDTLYFSQSHSQNYLLLTVDADVEVALVFDPNPTPLGIKLTPKSASSRRIVTKTT